MSLSNGDNNECSHSRLKFIRRVFRQPAVSRKPTLASSTLIESHEHLLNDTLRINLRSRCSFQARGGIRLATMARTLIWIYPMESMTLSNGSIHARLDTALPIPLFTFAIYHFEQKRSVARTTNAQCQSNRTKLIRLRLIMVLDRRRTATNRGSSNSKSRSCSKQHNRELAVLSRTLPP